MISVLASLSTALRFRLPRCVLFDADGTLLNSLPAHIEFCRTLNDERALVVQRATKFDVRGQRVEERAVGVEEDAAREAEAERGRQGGEDGDHG